MPFRIALAAACLATAAPAAAQHSTGNALPAEPERDMEPAPAQPASPPPSHGQAGAAAGDLDLLKSTGTPGAGNGRPPGQTGASGHSAPPANPPARPATGPAPSGPVDQPAPQPASGARPAAASQTVSSAPAATPRGVSARASRKLEAYGGELEGWQVWAGARSGCWAVKPTVDQAAPQPAGDRLFEGPKPYLAMSMTPGDTRPSWRIIHEGLPTEDDRIFVEGGADWVETSSFADIRELDGKAIDVYGKGEMLRGDVRMTFETTGKIEMSGLGATLDRLARCARGEDAPAVDPSPDTPATSAEAAPAADPADDT